MKNTFKRVLTLVLSLALIASCMAGLSLAANAEGAVIAAAENASEAYITDFEDGDLTSWTVQQNGTVEIAENIGGRTGKLMKYSGGTASYSAPSMTAAATEKVVTSAGLYKVEFDLYIESLPVEKLGNIPLLLRNNANAGENTALDYAKTTGDFVAGNWYHISSYGAVNNAWNEKTTRFCFDTIGQNSVFYIDNFSFSKVDGAVKLSVSNNKVFDNTVANYAGPFAGLTDDDFTDNIAKVTLLIYNASETTGASVELAGYWGTGIKTVGTSTNVGVTTTTIGAKATKIFTYDIPKVCDVFNSGAVYQAEQTYDKLGFRFNSLANAADIYFYVLDNEKVQGSFVSWAVKKSGVGSLADEADLSAEFYDIYKFGAYQMRNGDVENGIDYNWKTFTNGGYDLSTDTPDGTGHSAKFTATGAYGSVGYYLSPAIVNKPELHLNGAGVGRYIIEFDAKSESGDLGGNSGFTVDVQSACHKQASDAPEGSGVTTATYAQIGSITLHEEWTHYTLTANLSQAYFDTLEYYYSHGNSNAYTLMLRFDLGSFFTANGITPYYIDNVTIKTYNPDAVVFDLNGVYDENEDVNPYAYLTTSTGGGYLLNTVGYTSDYTGPVEMSYYFYNFSDETLKISMGAQATVSIYLKDTDAEPTPQWVAPKGNTNLTLEPYTGDVLSFTMDAVDGKVTGKFGDAKGIDHEVPLSSFFARMDVRGVGGSTETNSFRTEHPVLIAVPQLETESVEKFVTDEGNARHNVTLKAVDYDDIAAKGANVAIGEDLTVNFYGSAPGSMTLNGVKIGGTYDETNKVYKFAYTGVNPQCMGDEISGTYTDCFGNEIAIDAYSVKTYCEEMAAKTDDEELLTLLADMLEYGAAAQEYMGYKTTQKVNDVEALAAYKTTDAVKPGSDQSSVKEPGYTARVKSMQLKLNNKLNIIANIETTEDWLVNVYEDGDILADNVDYIMDTANNQVIITNLPATKIGTVYTIEVYVGGELQNTVTYSMNSYISSKWAKGDNTAALVQALYNFGMSTIAFAA